MTFPELFATGLKKQLNPGPHRCFWCGASCDEQHRVSVSNTFWDWDTVAFPKSQFQCVGCCECLDEKRSIPGKDKLQKTRNYSWFASTKEAIPLTKAHLSTIRDLCLSQKQSEPWGLAIADTGQKHILFRTPVNEPNSRVVAVQLEQSTVKYHPPDLGEAIKFCARLGAVIGKPALSGPLTADFGYKLFSSGFDPQLIETWNAVWNSPMWRLAAFLCPGKDDCLDYLEENDD